MEENTRKERENTVNMVNLNKADTDKLARLGGIGKKLAYELIRYREEHGGFKDLDEIDRVRGFDKISAEKIKKNLYL